MASKHRLLASLEEFSTFAWLCMLHGAAPSHCMCVFEVVIEVQGGGGVPMADNQVDPLVKPAHLVHVGHVIYSCRWLPRPCVPCLCLDASVLCSHSCTHQQALQNNCLGIHFYVCGA